MKSYKQELIRIRNPKRTGRNPGHIQTILHGGITCSTNTKLMRVKLSEEERKARKRERNRKYYKANPEKVKEMKRKWREANPEKVREYKRKYYEANREKVIERSRKWHEANPEKAREIRRKWYKTNPEKAREMEAKSKKRTVLIRKLRDQSRQSIKAPKHVGACRTKVLPLSASESIFFQMVSAVNQTQNFAQQLVTQ